LRWWHDAADSAENAEHLEIEKASCRPTPRLTCAGPGGGAVARFGRYNKRQCLLTPQNRNRRWRRSVTGDSASRRPALLCSGRLKTGRNHCAPRQNEPIIAHFSSPHESPPIPASRLLLSRRSPCFTACGACGRLRRRFPGRPPPLRCRRFGAVRWCQPSDGRGQGSFPRAGRVDPRPGGNAGDRQERAIGGRRYPASPARG